MCINVVHKDEIRHPSHILEDFSGAMIHLVSERKALKPPTLTDLINAQYEDAF